ncbi:hypothetical protein EVAR_14340_1 [Eumeta japonica]|uniref:Uncharacterized protein n=1 Tax=Eumeta variegata TaxID=151549 RepID=A0A4C1TWY9_EUMVA|nr:hypothetical protein EVAR_14340_1 [Eumeta japonica]
MCITPGRSSPVAGAPILCYDCNSAYDPRCGEEFDSFSLGIINCSLRDPPEHLPHLESTICRSIKMEINGKVRIVRKCGYIVDPAPEESSCQRRSGFHEMYVTYCACDTDLCNRADAAAGPAMTLTLSAVIAYAAV